MNQRLARYNDMIEAGIKKLKESGWNNKGGMARAKNGDQVNYGSNEAASFCGIGAILAASKNVYPHSEANQLWDDIDEWMHAQGLSNFASWNDEVALSKEEVIIKLRQYQKARLGGSPS